MIEEAIVGWRSCGLVRSQTTGRNYCNDWGHGCNCPSRPELVTM